MIKVVFGFLGTKLDAMGGYGEKRHKVWRPSVSLGLDATLGLDRFEMWHDPRFARLATTIKGDIERGPSEPKVILHESPIRDPWNFEEVYR